MDEDKASLPVYDYATFPRVFVSYRWFKPLLVLALGFVFMLVIQVALIIAGTIWAGDLDFLTSFTVSYDSMDFYTGPGALVTIGGVAAILPALALALLVVGDRPFSSLSSSRGGWNWSTFGKCTAVAVAVMGALAAIDAASVASGAIEPAPVKFTIAGFVMCTLLVPVQCVAEEYVFRGFALQTVASWTKLPAAGIVAAAAMFAVGHPYNGIGMATIFCNGLIWGFVAWKTKGLEATAALHIVNNLIAFYEDGFGLVAQSSDISVTAMVIAVAIDAVFAAIVVVVGSKRGWFAARCDGAAAFNQKKRAKMARKEAQRQASADGRPVAPQRDDE